MHEGTRAIRIIATAARIPLRGDYRIVQATGGAVAEARSLLTADGVVVSAVRLDRDGPPGSSDDRELAIVVAHGFTGSWAKPSVRRAARALSAFGGVVVPDLRGHGASGGWSTLGDREIHDVAAATAWARLLGYRSVATVGFSMGSSVVVRHAALIGGTDAVVAVSGPSRWYYRGTHRMRQVHRLVERRGGRTVARLALRTRLGRDDWVEVPEEPRAVVARIAPVPLLVVHGDEDAYFPVEHGEQLAAASEGHSELWIEPGFGHAEAAASDELLSRIGAWIRAAVDLGP
jgi:pimeloyl-ACP methyl ester carboxylesterase